MKSNIKKKMLSDSKKRHRLYLLLQYSDKHKVTTYNLHHFKTKNISNNFNIISSSDTNLPLFKHLLSFVSHNPVTLPLTKFSDAMERI